ncbi:MAG: DUF4870 domain-containing protein [Candidatus Hydrothermarchaeales archaeon]
MTDTSKNSPTQDSNVKGALCYFPFIGWIISVFFILTEKEDQYVRFNALQSVLLLFLYIAVSIFLSLISGMLALMIYVGLLIGVVSNLLAPAYLVITVFLTYKSYTGERFMLPKLGGFAEKNV